MSKNECPDCQGRGRWQERHDQGEEVEIVARECGTCHGTGKKPNPDEIPVYDVGDEDEY